MTMATTILILCSGVARTQPILGHSMGTLHLWEFQRKTKKQTWGVWGDAPTESFWASKVGSEAISHHTVTLNQEHFHYARIVRGVKSLHNTHGKLACSEIRGVYETSL